MHQNNMQEMAQNGESLGGVVFVSPTPKVKNLDELILTGVELKKMLHEKGALLLRGFNVDNPDKFKSIAGLFADDLMSDNGEHIPLSNTDKVYTPVGYSAKEKLLWHNENSFNYNWPLMIMFACLKPAEKGGETPLVDCCKVLESLDSEVVAEFKQKGVMYVRTHGFGFGRTWQETYRTDSKSEMERICKERGIQLQWGEGDQLITKQVRPAIVNHPISGVPTWFTQAQHWHPYCLKPEIREYFLATFSEDQQPRNCYFGDGSIISDDIMQHILDVYAKLEVSFPWQAGDVVVLDNVLFAHARNAYHGERKLLVTMGRHAVFTEAVAGNSRLMGQ